MKTLGLFSASLFLCLSAFAERQSFERYQSVVDRQMFGPPPEGFDPTKPPSEAVSSRDAEKKAQALSKEQEKIKSAIHFSMINVTPAGETAVGFTDSSDAKNPVNYYLKVGESRNGWTVKEADPVASSMTIVKDDIEVSLTIGGNSAKGAGKTSSVAASAAPAGRAASAGGFGSLRARRNQRRAEEQARMAEFDKKMKEREAALEKRQQEEQARREEENARQAEEKARQAEENAAREQERAEQRKQLLQIQEELRRAREEKAKEEKSGAEEGEEKE